MQIRPITKANVRLIKLEPTSTNQLKQKKDSFSFENRCVDKRLLLDRRIIKDEQDINIFYDSISSQIFSSPSMNHIFSNLLKMGYVALSTSAYANLSDPKSAIGLEFNNKKTTTQHCALLEEYIKNGVGVGVNLSNLNNPIYEIKKINEYLKYREPNLNRPPAGIGLLNITNSKIMEFIALKDEERYEDWCFDLSVVMDSEFLSKVDNDDDLCLDNGLKIKARKIYYKLLDSMLKKGEPGIIFSDNKEFICDSCAASELQKGEGLSLAQINLAKFYNKSSQEFDYEFLSQCANILAIALKKIAPNGFISILGYQDLLNQMGLNYGSAEANEVLERILLTIRKQAEKEQIRMCISPTGATSRILKTTPSIEPFDNSNVTYWDEIETLAVAQKYLDGGISKTINLKSHHTIQDVDLIVRECQKRGIKGITVFPVR